MGSKTVGYNLVVGLVVNRTEVYRPGFRPVGTRTEVYSLVVELWVLNRSIQSSSGFVGSRTVLFRLVEELWVRKQYYTVW